MEQFLSLAGKGREELKLIYDGLKHRKRYLLNDIAETEKMLEKENNNYMRAKDLKDDIRDSKLEISGIDQKITKLVNYASLKGIELEPKQEEKPKLMIKKV